MADRIKERSGSPVSIAPLTAEEASVREAQSAGASEALPSSFALEAPYPNPTAGDVAVPLALPEPAEVEAAVYDVLGRQVRTLARRSLGAGRPELTFRADALASGLYLIRVRVVPAGGEERVFTERVTVVR